MTTFTGRASPWSGANAHAYRGCYSASLDRIVWTGSDVPNASIATSDDRGVTWVGHVVADAPSCFDVAWSPPLGRFVAATLFGIIHSTNGTSWTFVQVGTWFFPSAIVWSSNQGIFVAAGSGYSAYYSAPPNEDIWTSPDGLVWTPQGAPPLMTGPQGLAYSAAHDRWALADSSGDVWTSPNAITWTRHTTPFSGGGTLHAIRWFPTAGVFVATGVNAANTATMITSAGGIAWTTTAASPLDQGTCYDACEVGDTWFAGGRDIGGFQTYSSDDSGATWTLCPGDMDGFSFTAIYGLLTTPTTIVAGGYIGSDTFTMMSAERPTPSFASSRFFEGYPWRFIVTDIAAPAATPPTLGTVTTTWAQGIMTNRQITKTLNQPTTIQCAVWPDDERVNEGFVDDFPLVAQNNRLIYAFRREGGNPPWKIRAAGILMAIEDQGDPDIPLSHLTAYDPWQYLMGRPVVDADGNPPVTAYGFQYPGWNGNDIARTILKNSIASDGPAFIDAGVAWGGTAFYGGTIESTDQLVFTIQQGATVGDVWQQLCDTGTMDIVLEPIYDPFNRPGYTHELNIYRLAGDDLPGVVFGWDKLNRALTTADRMHSGTPGDFVNRILYYGGSGIPFGVTLNNGASIDTFGVYWTTQVFPALQMPGNQTPQLLAAQALRLGRQGKRTFTSNPTPERAPIPIRDYDVGDRVGIYTTKRLRVVSGASFVEPIQAQRVQTIPIVVDDDGIERIQALVTSPDYRTAADDPPEQPAVAKAVKNLGSTTAVTTSRRRPSTMYQVGRRR